MLLLLAAALGFCAPSFAADQTRYFPLDNPVYDYLDRLQERGRLPGLNRALRPYTRARVLAAVDSAGRDGALRPVERAWLENVRRECLTGVLAAAPARGDSARLAVIVRPEAAVLSRTTGQDEQQGEAGVGFGGRFGHVVFDARFLRAPHLLRPADTTAHRDQSVTPPSRDGLIRPMQAYLKADFDLWSGSFGSELFLGRMARNWSPALDRSLILGAQSLSFDQLAFRLESRHLVFSHLVAQLDDIRYLPEGSGSRERARRFLTAHRLDIRIRDRLRFGITETTVYGGADRGFDLALSNPFTSYRLTAMQESGTHANNTLLAVDGFWSPADGRAAIYGQFMFDDLLRDEDIQNRWALDAGIDLRDPLPLPLATTLGLRATVVSSYAYNTFQPWERYLLRGRPLGAPTGNDYWEAGCLLRLFVTPGLDFTASLLRRERGALRIASPAGGLVGSAGLPFPTPPVERTTQASLRARWQPFEFAHLEAEGGVLRRRNLNNVDGLDRNRGYAEIYLAIYRDFIIEF